MSRSQGFVADLEGVYHAIWQERRTFLAFFSAVVLATGVGTAVTPKQYRANAVLQLMASAGQEVDVGKVVNLDDGGWAEKRDRARTRMQLIQSRTVREEVLRRYTSRGHTDLGTGTAGLEALAGSMSVSPREETDLVEVAVTHTDPDAAALLANLVVEVYTEANLSQRTGAARDTQGWLDGQSEGYKATLDEATKKVMSFKETHGVVDIDEKVDGISARLGSLQTAAGEATTRRVLAETAYGEHLGLLKRRQYDVLAGMYQDPALETMARQRAELVTASADVLARYGEKHPEHQRAAESISQVEALIAEEVRRNVDGERAEVETLRRIESELAAELELVKTDLLAKQKLQAEYRVLKGDEERASATLSSLGKRGAEVDLQASTQLNDVRVVDRAVAPTRPFTPNVKLNLAVGFVVGLAAGLGVALLRHRLVGSLLSAADVERYTHTTLLASIPQLNTSIVPAQRDLYTFEHPRSFAAEAFRSLRAVLEVAGPAKGRRIVITSCIEGEGKSLCALGIAVAYAQLGRRVLLIDADLRLPRLHKVFGVEEAPGLSDAMIHEDELHHCTIRTPIPRLDLMRCGERVDYPNEFVSAPELERVLDRLSAQYDIVLLDTPPAGLVADAVSLARVCEGAILVVRAGKAPGRLVHQTLQGLQQGGANVVGVLLNDVPRRPGDPGYGNKYYSDRPRTVRGGPA